MRINDKDAGFPFKLVGVGLLSALAGGAGDNTEAAGEIVDVQAQPGLTSGLIVIIGEATVATSETLDIKTIKIEHGDESNLSDAADYLFGLPSGAAVTETDVLDGDNGTYAVRVKVNVDLTGVKRYWRVALTPDLSASGTDTADIAFGVAAIGENAPQTSP